MCVCNPRYPVCKSHTPYCHLCSVRLHIFFLLFLISGKIFGNKWLNIISGLWFSVQILSKTLFILNRIQRGITNYIDLYAKCTLFFQVLIEIEFSRQILEKSSSINLINSFHWKLRCCMRTVRQAELMKVTVAFQKFANATKIIWSHVRNFLKHFTS
jgi:hypothetical protein